MIVFRKVEQIRLITLVLVFVLVFSCVTFINAEPTYAASKPAKVSGLKVSAKTGTTISIKWSKAKRATKYKIAYRTAGGKWYYKTTKSRSYTFKSLKNYTYYSYKVRGVRGKRYGKWSSAVGIYTDPNTGSDAYKTSLYNLPVITGVNVEMRGPASITLEWTTEADEVATLDPENETSEAPAQTEDTQPSDESVQPENSDKATDGGSALPENATENVVDTLADENSSDINSTDNSESTSSAYEDKVVGEIQSGDNEVAEVQEEPGQDQQSDQDQEEEPVPKDFSRATYRIYQSSNGKTWSLVASGISGDKREYTVRKLLMNSTYYFKIVAQDAKTFKNYTVVASTAEGDGMCAVTSGKTTVINGLSFKTAYTKNNLSYKQNRSYSVSGLMLHSVGANKETAQYWYNVYNKKNYNAAAVHAFIDGPTGVVWQTLPWSMRGGHAGSVANDKYIGVEMCESKYISYYKNSKERKKHGGKWFSISNKSKALKSAETTYNSSVKLFAYLCDYYGLNPTGKNVIISHNEWRKMGHSGHYDPEHYWSGLGTGYTMSKFRAAVKTTLDASRVQVSD